jgi:3-hydroxyacyl-[acyl-carrier-protein] dehydratase
MNREELKQYLPHREPMLFVDEIDIDQDGIANARYRIVKMNSFVKDIFRVTRWFQESYNVR